MSGHYKIEKTQGKTRLFLSAFGWGMRANATCYEDRETAEGYARDVGGIVKRWLTPAESRRKAAAEALRELAAEIQSGVMRPSEASEVSVDHRRFYNAGCQDTARWLAAKADALWPRKGAKKS